MTVSEYPNKAYQVFRNAKEFLIREIELAEETNNLPQKRCGFLWKKKRQMTTNEYASYVAKGIRCGYLYGEIQRKTSESRLDAAVIVFVVAAEMKIVANKIMEEYPYSKCGMAISEREDFLMLSIPKDSFEDKLFLACLFEGGWLEVLKNSIA